LEKAESFLKLNFLLPLSKNAQGKEMENVVGRIVYLSGSQPFRLQVQVKEQFLSYRPGQNFPRIMCIMDQKHQIDAKL